jgi:hypothetical protein
VLYLLVPSGGGDGLTAATLEGSAPASRQAGGWMLLALHGQRRYWSMPLLGRGAAITAPARVAQAVAVRVLNDLGVHVHAWHDGGSADRPVYRAELEAPPEPAPTPVRRRHPQARTHRLVTWGTRAMVSLADRPRVRPRRRARTLR